MKLYKYSFILIIAFIAFIVSCERATTIDLPTAESQLVVDAAIEAGGAPYVVITKSSNYFDPVDINTINSLFITDATVIITDGILIDTLQGSLQEGKGFVYEAQKIIGEVGKKYDLTIITNNQTLTASTTVNPPVPIDSAWFVKDPLFPNYGFGFIRLTDPDTLGNAYKFEIKRLGKDDDFLTDDNWNFDDQYINGTSARYLFERQISEAEREQEKIDQENQKVYTDEEIFAKTAFEVGDVIVIKNSSLNARTYQFWKDIDILKRNANSPFGQPANVIGNITGALGIFAGYSVVYDTIYTEQQ